MDDWNRSCDRDLEPYIVGGFDGASSYPPVFEVGEELPIPTVDQITRAAKYGWEIYIGPSSDSGIVVDFREVQPALPYLRRLRIADSTAVTGWGELEKAEALVHFILMDDGPSEVLHLADLPALTNAGVGGTKCLSVCSNSHVTNLALRLPKSRSTPEIQAPIVGLALTSKVSHLILDRMAKPDLLRRLLVVGAKDFDCRSLLRFPNLAELEFQSCNGILNVDLLSSVPRLRALEFFRCRDISDPDAIAILLRSLAERRVSVPASGGSEVGGGPSDESDIDSDNRNATPAPRRETLMGMWDNAPWGNDSAADWFSDLMDATSLRNEWLTGISADPQDEYEVVRAAAWLFIQLGRVYVWPIDDFDDDLVRTISALISVKAVDEVAEDEALVATIAAEIVELESRRSS